MRDKLRLLCLFVCCLPVVLPLSAGESLQDRYNKEHPLIVVGDWELPPYEFNNNYGEAMGFDIDVLTSIFKRMGICYTFVLKEDWLAYEIFEQQNAHLIVDKTELYLNRPSCYRSHSILDDYKLIVASRKDEKPIYSLSDLPTDAKYVVRTNDRRARLMLDSILPNAHPERHSSKYSLGGLVGGTYDYFIWGEEPLKWVVNSLNMEDKIALHKFVVCSSEVHFVCYDKELLDQIDDQYARMEQNGELQELRNKWMHRGKAATKWMPIAIGAIVFIVVVLIILWMLNRFAKRRVQIATLKSRDIESMMRQALSMGSYAVTVYDVTHDRVTNQQGQILLRKGVTLKQFIDHIHPEEQENALAEIKKLISGDNGIWELNLRWKTDLHAMEWHYIRGHAIAEKDDKGRTRYVVITVKDVTKDFEQERKDKELAERYFQIFDSTLVAMSFYNKEGRLIDLNESMRKLCGFDKDGEALFRNISMFDMGLLRGDVTPENPTYMHVCQHMYYPDAGLDKYIEFRVRPIFSEDELQIYIITARDITAERQMYLELYQHNEELNQANAMINHYEQELNYLLENCKMWVWHSDLATKTISISRSLKKSNYTETFDEFVDSLYDDEERRQKMDALGGMTGNIENFNVTIHLRSTPANASPHWVAISGIPLRDKYGKMRGHIGVLRDVTQLIEAQEMLKKETERAEDSGKLKSVFLANMTHEIRTPLNAIVGFSDLLQVITEPEDRQEFIRIIRNNCDMLIRLINDIIEASTLNQGPLAIETEDVDFAVAFNDICQTLAHRVQEPGVEFLVDNPYETFLTHLDKGRLQQVITNFTTNAVKYTHQGHIKVGYRYENGGIYMYCEDTGAGIPKEKQSMVFDRFVKLNDFVQGTGLGLSICKSIAERCGGRIGVDSEGEGKGSTFWIWIPCEKKN